MCEATSKAEPLRSLFTPVGNRRRGPTDGVLKAFARRGPHKGHPRIPRKALSTVIPRASARVQDAGVPVPGPQDPEGER